jgi:hypothetical protein
MYIFLIMQLSRKIWCEYDWKYLPPFQPIPLYIFYFRLFTLSSECAKTYVYIFFFIFLMIRIFSISTHLVQ